MSNIKKVTYLLIFIIPIFVFCAIRFPIFNLDESLKYISSDFAIYSLMAEDIITKKSFPFFFYGQNYMGPLSSIFIVISQFILNLFDVVHQVPYFKTNYVISPMAMPIAASSMILLSLLFYIKLLLRFFTKFQVFIFSILYSIGATTLFESSIRINGPEMVLLLSPLIMIFGFNLIDKNNKKNQFLFGSIIAFSWWMNQTVVFTIVPLLFYIVSKDDLYKNFRNNINLKDRLLLKNESSVKTFAKIFIFFTYIILLLNAIFGLITIYYGKIDTVIGSIKLKSSTGFSQIKSTIIGLLLIHGLIYFFKNKNKSIILIKEYFAKIKYFIYGAALVYAPIILGPKLGLYEKAYTIKFNIVKGQVLIDYWKLLLTDFFPRLLVDYKKFENIRLINFFYLVLVLFIISIIKSNFIIIKDYLLLKSKRYSLSTIFYGTFFFNSAFVFLSSRTQDQYALRYAILMIPSFYILIIASFKSKEIYNRALASILTIFLIYFNVNEANMFLDKILLTKSPKEELKALKESNFKYCYADFWSSYKYEYLTGKNIKFIVHNGQDRTPKWTKKRSKTNSPKCLFDENNYQNIKEFKL